MTGNIANKNNDLELVRRFKSGDITGFNEIVRKYQKQVYWVIRKMVHDHDEADDITQEVFIKVYTALMDFREESNLFTWLYSIAANYSLNHIKKVKVKNTVSVEMVTGQLESEYKRADEEIDDTNEEKCLNQQ